MEVHDIVPESLKKSLVDSLLAAPCHLMSDYPGIASHTFPGVYLIYDTGSHLSKPPASLRSLQSDGQFNDKMITYIGMSADGRGISARLQEARTHFRKSGGREFFAFYTFLRTTPVSAPSIELMFIKHFKPAGNTIGVDLIPKGVVSLQTADRPSKRPHAEGGEVDSSGVKRVKSDEARLFTVEEVLREVGIFRAKEVRNFPSSFFFFFSFFTLAIFLSNDINRAAPRRS